MLLTRKILCLLTYLFLLFLLLTIGTVTWLIVVSYVPPYHVSCITRVIKSYLITDNLVRIVHITNTTKNTHNTHNLTL